jgi:hypothetical protein
MNEMFCLIYIFDVVCSSRSILFFYFMRRMVVDYYKITVRSGIIMLHFLFVGENISSEGDNDC